jgi:hypothetical protein
MMLELLSKILHRPKYFHNTLSILHHLFITIQVKSYGNGKKEKLAYICYEKVSPNKRSIDT